MVNKLVSIIAVTTLLSVSTQCVAKLEIYQNINSTNFCFRRLNATHEIGCHSASDTTGILHYIKGRDDVLFVTEKGPDPPYVPLVQLANLSTSLLLEFKKASPRIAGVLVLKDAPTLNEDEISFSKVESFYTSDTSVPSIYSPETSCPNSKFSLYPESECRTPWVPANAALEMMSYSYPFSMILLTHQNDTNRVVNCFLKFNFDTSSSTVSTGWPRCAAEVTSSMNAAVDTPTCMARTENSWSDNALCAPLESRNIIASTASLEVQLKPIESNVIFVIARMDSLSMFEDLSPGAYSTIPGILGLFSVAETVTRTLREKVSSVLDKTIYFALLDGEAFGYIGSSALVWQIKENHSFGPFYRDNITSINFTNIHAVIELNQIASTNGSSDIWLHTDAVSFNQSVTKEIIEYIKGNARGTLNVKTATQSLPPSSLMSFLKEKRDLPVVHVTNHEKTYLTPYFNSFLDVPSAEWRKDIVEQVSKVSKVISLTLFQLLGVQASDIKVTSEENITQLTECLLFNGSCALFYKPLNDKVYSQYVSVHLNNHRGRLIDNLYQILSLWTSRERSDLSVKESCRPSENTSIANNFYWWDGRCFEAYTFTTRAMSPAFEHLREWNSTRYSTWSESYWTTASTRIFLVNKPLTQWVTFVFGVVLVLGTWLFTSYLQKNHSILFV